MNTVNDFDPACQKFFKNCPQCNDIQYYKVKTYRNQALKKKLICRVCYLKNKIAARDARAQKETLAQHKKCSTCKDFKTKNQFRTIAGSVKLQYDCNECLAAKNKKSQRVYYSTAHGRKQKNEAEARRRLRQPVTFLLHGARHRAKKAGLEFTITKEDIVIPEVCPVLGIQIIRGIGQPTDNSPTIDRIDSSRGYTKDNVAVISRRANVLKSNGTMEEFIQISDYIKRYLHK